MKQRRPFQDPFAEREAAKYENPIPSREFILNYLEKQGEPVSYEQLVSNLELKSEYEADALKRRLRAMERDGQLIFNRRGTYALVKKIDLIAGRVQGHKDGYGFVIPDDGGEDLYLNNRQIRAVLDGDRVLARVVGQDKRGRREGTIVEVIARNTHQVVGRFFREGGIAFVSPDNRRINQDILIAPDAQADAQHGQYVVAEITMQPSSRCPPQGRVLEVLGDHLAPGMEIDVAIRAHHIPHDWPEEVLTEIKNLLPHVSGEDKKNRIDIRHLPLVTIDGEDARDFDDAVYCEPVRDGWRLIVAIADVSYYVAVHSALDKEAYQRGNSVYFPGYVVPMLPEILSNGLCSLNPHVDRLCMVCDMVVTSSGRIKKYAFYEGLMLSRARLTYTEVGAMLAAKKSAEKNELREKYQEVTPHIDHLHELYKLLNKARQARGAIDFETTETRIVFGENKKIEKIIPVVRNDAHKLIEECMLSANVAAAHFLEDHDLIGLYRIHERPRDEKINDLREFLGEFGLGLGGGDEPTTMDYQALLQQAQKRKEARLIQTVMLRSMMQAVYSPENKGHFGLNYDAYAHFTSPIRRYPDLLVHRAIRSVIRSKKKSAHVERAKGATLLAEKEIYPYSGAAMLMHGEQCSMTERRADEATREVVSWLKCEYIQDRVGDTFDGTITAVTGFGLFVELQDIYVEGLVHVTSLVNDYYHFDAARHRLVGEHTGTTYRLGDPLRVKVIRVDLESRKIDFELADYIVGKKDKKNSKKIAEKKEEKEFGRYDKPVGLRGSKQGQPTKESFKQYAPVKNAKENEKIKNKKSIKKKRKKSSTDIPKTEVSLAQTPAFNIRKRRPEKPTS